MQSGTGGQKWQDEREIPLFPIRVAARLTGLTAHRLRAWERRHGLVRPARTPGRQRLYSLADIARLRALAARAAAGARPAALAREGAGGGPGCDSGKPAVTSPGPAR